MADWTHPAGKHTGLTQAIHWITAGLMIVVLPAGLLIEHLKDDAKSVGYAVHEWLGLTIFAVAILRLLWRVANPPPPLPADLSPTLHFLARFNHVALYVMLFSQPVVGFLMTNAFGFPVNLFGVLPLPNPIGENEPVANVLLAMHSAGGWIIIALLAAHVGGALYHHLIRKDGVLLRMM